MDPFATLGMARRYDLDSDELERRYRELQRALHPDKHLADAPSARRNALGKAVEVNEAYRVLRDRQRRAEALLALLRGAQAPATGPAREPADPELLTEVMELREALGESKHAGDRAAVARLATRVQGLHERTDTQLREAFAKLDDGVGVGESTRAAELERLSSLVSRFKYYQRFLDEVRAYEEA
jgi:molecular chaperone HscB